uniref:Charged multivesicular body protein 6 n=1 Tax=Setaria digitata TaxID=48799 RepID=A0A915PJJ7_9BILA
MKQFIRRNEKQMQREKELAKRLIQASKKDRALLILKRKRYQESVAERMLRQLDKIERMVNDLEFAVIEQKVVEELRQGNEALKRMNQMFSIGDIEKIMDETKEAAEFQEEISNMLNGKLNEDDLEEVENEFAKLVEEEEEGRLHLPEVPSGPFPAKIPEQLSAGKLI